MRVAGLVRVSTTQQLDISPDAQKRIIIDYCEKNNLELYKIYSDEGQSASIKEGKVQRTKVDVGNGFDFIIKYRINNRDGFVTMINDCSKKLFDIIIVVKWDRFSRNYPFSYNFLLFLQEEYNIKVMAVQEGNDELLKSILAVISQNEIRQLKQRIHNSRYELFQKGFHPYKSVLGYKMNFEIVGNKKYNKGMILSDDAVIVKDVFAHFLVTKKFDYKFFVQKYGRQAVFYYNIFWYVDLYAGFISYNGEVKQGVHEPLINGDDYEKIKELLMKQGYKTQNW